MIARAAVGAVVACFLLATSGCAYSGHEAQQTASPVQELTTANAGSKYAELKRKNPGVNGMYQTGATDFTVIIPATDTQLESTVRSFGFHPRKSDIGERELQGVQDEVLKADPTGDGIRGLAIDLPRLTVVATMSTAASNGALGAKVRAMKNVTVKVSDSTNSGA